MLSSEQGIQTARKLGLMRGFPPAPLPYRLHDLSSVTYRNLAGNEFYSAFAPLTAAGAWLVAQV